MQKFHGIELQEGGFIKNLRIENINDTDGVPDDITTTGRIWFNEKIQRLQYTFNENGLDVKTVGAAGWSNLLGNMTTGKTGKNNSPLWENLGNGFYSWIFADNKTLELQLQFHTNHQIDYTKKVLAHIHWLPLSTSTGTVKWNIKIKIARSLKGDLLTGAADYNFSMYTQSNGVYGEHLVFEDLVNTIDAIEPDCIMLISLVRDGTHSSDTFVGSVGAVYFDFHYWSDKQNTPGRIVDYDTPFEPIPN